MQEKISRNAINLILDKLSKAIGVNTDTELANVLGVKQNTVSSWRSRGSIDFALIISKCDDIDLNWLFNERDINLDYPQTEKYKAKSTENATISDSNKNGNKIGNKRKVQNTLPNEGEYIHSVNAADVKGAHHVLSHPEVLIPIVDISAAAGSGAYNTDYPEQIDTICLPEKLLHKGTHNCIKIKGDSMAPTLQDGGYIVIRLLDRSEWVDIKTDYIYVVTDRTGKTSIKRLRNRLKEHGFIVCTSDNPAYNNFNLDEDEIHNVWFVEWYLSAKMPNIHATYYDQVQQLRDDVDDIQALLARHLKKPIQPV